ncbi:MAG: copper chaperone [Chitinophagales bacterium]|nr:copper chaperone [Chitinophagales bacterium]
MKRYFQLFLIIALAFSVNAVSAKGNLTTDTIDVNGNCDMCKMRIEKATMVKGVRYANWNMDTHRLAIKYDTKTINRDEIEKRIAAAGHDTENYKAEDKAYQALPRCCQYREE